LKAICAVHHIKVWGTYSGRLITNNAVLHCTGHLASVVSIGSVLISEAVLAVVNLLRTYRHRATIN
jgi:hypothetical protein